MVVAERANDLVAMGAPDRPDRTESRRGRAMASIRRRPGPGSTVNGKIYGIPAFTFVDWMYYRKDWFAEAGIAPPKTYQEFLEAAIKLYRPRQEPLRPRPARRRRRLQIRARPVRVLGLADRRGRQAGDRQEEGRPRPSTSMPSILTKHKAAPAERAQRRLPADHGSLQDRADRDGLAPHRLAHGNPGRAEAGAIRHAAHAGRPGCAYRAPDLSLQRHLEPGERGRCLGLDLVLGGAGARRSPSSRRPATSRPPPRSPPTSASPATRSTPRPSRRPSSAACRRPSSACAGWSENVVLPEFQKVLVGRATAEQAVDAMMSGLEAALK